MRWKALATFFIFCAATPVDASPLIISQSFFGNFQTHNTTFSNEVGALQLNPGQSILSGTLDYRYGVFFSEFYGPTPGEDPPTYSGYLSSGFGISGTSIAIFTQTNVAGSCTIFCEVGDGSSGHISIAPTDFDAFVGDTPLIAFGDGYSSIYINGGLRSPISTSFSYSGVLTFVIADAPAVPEPETWMMMLVGLGLVAFGLRNRSRQSARGAFA